MSWLSDLYETYEANTSEVAKNLEEKAILLPVAHSTQNAQIEVQINAQGEFVTAHKIDKSDAITIIPVTEDSATRGNGNTPHPLEDKLVYIAGDYQKYTGIDNQEKYEKFITQLNRWRNSEYSCWELQAIGSYLEKGQLISDLVACSVLEVNEGLLSEVKIEGINQKEAFVRFSVISSKEDLIGTERGIYKNNSVFELYTKYYVSMQGGVDLCYASGQEIPCSNKHPAKIRHSRDKAKLISANDSAGFTYRGRLSEGEQVASIGYETSQKAHNALRWLIGKQGFSAGEMVVVAWEISGKRIVPIMMDTQDGLFGEDLFDNDYEERGFTNEEYARKLKQAINGYKRDLTAKESIVVMGVEAATTGRLSVNFYKKMTGSEFIEHVNNWHKTCFWRHRYKKNAEKGSYAWFVGAPSPKDIAITAYGDKNDKLIKATIERILPCIVDGKKLPSDIVKAAINRVSNPNSFENDFSYKKAVSITCALVRKKQYDDKGVEWEMALDRSNKDRSYVFGRLLGAAQKLEEVALFYSGEQSRSTAAERFSQQFVRRPGRTWKIINDNLRPYIAKLKAMGKTWYVKELQEIYDLIDEEEFKKQEPLSEVYLLGYNCQLNSYDKKDNEKTKEENK